jgi:hypothetical protein
MAPGFATASSLREDLLLQRHVLEHRLDDQVGIGQGGVVERRRNQRQALFHLLRLQAAARNRTLVVPAEGGQPPVERLLPGVDEAHRDAGVGEAHADAAAHGAGADDADLRHLARFHVGRQSGDLAQLALGEEEMAEGAALDGALDLIGQRALALDARVERQLDRRLHGVEQHVVRIAVPEGFRGGGAARGDDLAGFLGAGNRPLARAARTAAGGCKLARVGHRGGGHVPLDHRLHQTDFCRIAGGQRLAGEHHLQRRLEADQARHALRAAGAGDDAEGDFRQAELGAFLRDTVVAGDGRLDAAAHHRAMQRCHHRHRAVLDQAQHLVVAGLEDACLEFAHVAAGKKGLAGAGQHDALHGGVAAQRREGGLEAGAHLARQGVDGGAVDRDDGDVALHRNIHCFAHFVAPAKIWRKSPHLPFPEAFRRVAGTDF